MKKLILIVSVLLIIHNLSAQELNCRVQISHSQIQGTNVDIFNDMQKDIYEFMNNQRWTDHVFAADERIECTIMITLSKQIGTEKFIGTISVQARRPVYNTTYYTTLFNFKEKKDDFQFEYIQQQALTFNINNHSSNLVSVLAYYAYLIIGLDYDTFSEGGGAPYFAKAQQIVNNAQGAIEPGWKSYETAKMNNRYWLVENLTNESYSDTHRFMYAYHRKGFDMLSERLEEGRAEVAKSLEYLRNVYRKKPNLYIVKLLVNAKSDEIIKLMSESFSREQSEVYNIMVEIDPANVADYGRIKNSK